MKMSLGIFRTGFCLLLTIIISFLVIVSRLLMKPRDIWELLLRYWPHSMLYFLKIRLEVDGRSNLKGPAIFIMNHQSLADICILPALVPPTSTVLVKKEIKNIPLISQVAKAGNCIFVDRQDSAKAVASINQGLKELPKHYSLLIFPEGTRSSDFKLHRFKKGVAHIAIQTRLPIIPIGASGLESIGGGKRKIMNPGVVSVCVGKQIDTSTWSVDKIDQHVDQLFESVKSCVNKAKKTQK